MFGSLEQNTRLCSARDCLYLYTLPQSGQLRSIKVAANWCTFMEGLSKPVQQQSMGRELNNIYNSNLHTTNNILLERFFNLNSYIKPYHLPFTLFNYFNVM